jgi:large subunit ribosomal protein L29
MRAEEVREMSTEDIQARVAELEEERFRLRFRSATEPLENPLRLRTIRKDIARLKTVLTERKAGGGKPEAAANPTGKATPKVKAKATAKEHSRNG